MYTHIYLVSRNEEILSIEILSRESVEKRLKKRKEEKKSQFSNGSIIQNKRETNVSRKKNLNRQRNNDKNSRLYKVNSSKQKCVQRREREGRERDDCK